MLNVGRICVKTAGREAGKFCVIVDVLEDGFVLVTGPKVVTSVKRRKCNVDHLEPTPEVIKIDKNASDDAVMGAYKKNDVFGKMKVEQPTAKDIESAKESERKRLAMKKEEPKAKPAEKKPEAKVEKKEEKKEPHKEKKTEKKEAEKKKPEKKPAKKPASKKSAKAKGKKK